MKSSRYNLKRRVASLPPLSSEVFSEKVLTAQASSSAEAAKASFERSCQVCQKTYFSENAYQNHIGSQKHKANLLTARQNGVEDETESVVASTMSLGDPVESSAATFDDSDAEEEFSKVVQGMKEAKISDQGPVSQRPRRPHHSGAEQRLDHPLSPEASRPKPSSQAENINQVENCLFCNYRSPTQPLNIMHMSKQHGMFIPEQSFLVNVKGLLEYLSEKVREDYQCLYCNKFRGSATGVQTHMRDKGHCMIAFDTEDEMIEVGQFYDFRSTYSDDEDEESDDEKGAAGGVKLDKKSAKAKTVVKSEDSDEDESDEGDGWETDSSGSSIASEELGRVYADHHNEKSLKRLALNHHHSHFDPRPHHNVDGWHSHAHSHRAVYHSDYELHLPSGKSVGHRSLNRYYRQNLHSHPQPRLRSPPPLHRAIEDETDSEDAETEPEEEEQQTVQRGRNERGRQVTTRANGGLGMIGVSDSKKREVKAVEQRTRRQENRERLRYQWGNNKRANAQKHFRVSCNDSTRLLLLTFNRIPCFNEILLSLSWLKHL
jgi:pre-60S factor REI1